MSTSFVAALVLGALLAISGDPGPAADAAQGDAAPGDEIGTPTPGEPPHPLEEARRARRADAIDAVLAGTATPERRNGATVVRVGSDPTTPQGNGADDRGADDSGTDGTGAAVGSRAVGAADPHKAPYVKLANEGTDKVFVLLVEFGDERHPDFPDVDTDPSTPGPELFDGPRHNTIPEPDRSLDNTTIWEPDFDREYFKELYFGGGRGVESLKTYYQRQSSGRYSIRGKITAWVRVPYNQARYGRSSGYPCAGTVCSNAWDLVADGMNAWYQLQLDRGRSHEHIQAELANYDRQDRYDFDGDGDFNEPDGYIDRLQIVHAGTGQSDGHPEHGEDAIWSHRWYAYVSSVGFTGPTYNRLGGTQIGNSGIWAGDYTVQPENGGLSTIAHEYGHDLGLPDHYDTRGGRNGVEWWSLMGQNRLSAPGEPIGTRAADLSAWDKLMLGWLDYEVAAAGSEAVYELGPHEYNSDQLQALVVSLPPKLADVRHVTPYAGLRVWWSGRGDGVDHTMTTAPDLATARRATLQFQANYDVEAGFDHFSVEASTDGGATWTALDGTVDGAPFTTARGGPAITGSSGGAWVPVRVSLDPALGPDARIRLRYRTDASTSGYGVFVDNLSVVADGTSLSFGGAENDSDTWTLDGFAISSGVEAEEFAHYYLASHRTYVSYDKYLETGPYHFGFSSTRPGWVEHFPYMQGLLVSYWDTSQTDNDTSVHPGAGLILPIDSHPEPLRTGDGVPWRSRVQVYDAPFSLDAPASFTLHVDGRPSTVGGADAMPTFDDSRSYWHPAIPQVGVKVPDTGTRIRVLSSDSTTMRIRLTHH